MKVKCLLCGDEFEGSISLDELGWHSYCEECDQSFDVDVPEGKIVMAFTDRLDRIDDNCEEDEDIYKYFTTDFTGDCVTSYYAFNTPEEFLEKWNEISENPDGMWYWVLNDGELIVSGACDPNDIDVFNEYWKLKNNNKKYYEIEFDNDVRCRDDTDETIGEYSICIIGKRKPSYKEAEEFCKEDMKITGYKHVVAIREIDAYEAHTFFDMENEDKFPVFE